MTCKEEWIPSFEKAMEDIKEEKEICREAAARILHQNEKTIMSKEEWLHSYEVAVEEIAEEKDIEGE